MARVKRTKKSSNERIIAVSYLRKSTDGETTDAEGNKHERQESSLDRQRGVVAKLESEGGYKIVREYFDAGVSGWKLGAKRPDFTKMLDEVEALGAKAILCEDIDRFSRATVKQVQAVAV